MDQELEGTTSFDGRLNIKMRLFTAIRNHRIPLIKTAQKITQN
jgi:hypothetical protein